MPIKNSHDYINILGMNIQKLLTLGRKEPGLSSGLKAVEMSDDDKARSHLEAIEDLAPQNKLMIALHREIVRATGNNRYLVGKEVDLTIDANSEVNADELAQKLSEMVEAANMDPLPIPKQGNSLMVGSNQRDSILKGFNEILAATSQYAKMKEDIMPNVLHQKNPSQPQLPRMGTK